MAANGLAAEMVAPDEAHRRAAAGIAEQRQAVDGDACCADLLQHGPQRLGHPLEMAASSGPVSVIEKRYSLMTWGWPKLSSSSR